MNGPTLCVNFAPELDFHVTCVAARSYVAGSPEYRFEVNCRLRHPSGYFEYFADNLCFDPKNFYDFADQLACMQRGSENSAVLKNVGEMLVLRLDQSERTLHLGLAIREYLPSGGLPSLTANFEVDYDLFVNKLVSVLNEFLTDLSRIEPERV